MVTKLNICLGNRKDFHKMIANLGIHFLPNRWTSSNPPTEIRMPQSTQLILYLFRIIYNHFCHELVKYLMYFIETYTNLVKARLISANFDSTVVSKRILCQLLPKRTEFSALTGQSTPRLPNINTIFHKIFPQNKVQKYLI